MSEASAVQGQSEPILLQDISIVSEFKFSGLISDFNPDEEKRKDAEEEILNPSNNRLTIKPIDPRFNDIWSNHVQQRDAHWTVGMIDLSEDKHDYKKCDENLQHFIKSILAFFAGADSIVNENIDINLSKITIREAKVAYAFQEMMENVHGEVYANMLTEIIENPQERIDLINAFRTVRSIKLMIEWAQRWINSERRIAFSIAVFTIFEGLMFSSAFASIYWLKKYLGEDKMKGFIQSNNYIAKDEGMHTEFGFLMYSKIKHRLSQDEMNILMSEAVDISKIFTRDAIKVEMIGMNISLMDQYLEYVADRLMMSLNYDKIFGTKIPDQFQFMDSIGFLNKENFFEKRPTEYQKAYNTKNTAGYKFKLIDNY